MSHYILNGKEVVHVENIIEWAQKFESQNRTIAKDTINGIDVSTVFLGLDHQFGEGKPLLFETMVFGGKLD